MDNLMRALKIAASAGLLVCIVWFVMDPGFEPLTGAIAALLGLGGLFGREAKGRGTNTTKQDQSVSGASTGFQAGRDIHYSRERERSGE
ncbi:hypothetical protein EGK76_09470 [Luteimonas sp. 100069]|nr:hypothetical protein EGK76_09470 [Luteimonas sp. 100069]